MYQYAAELIRVVDGDTVVLDVDVGFNIKVLTKFRLANIDAPEIETAAGKLSRAWLMEAMKGKLRIDSLGLDKYGRWLAVVHCNGININELMLNLGHATPYAGGKR